MTKHTFELLFEDGDYKSILKLFDEAQSIQHRSFKWSTETLFWVYRAKQKIMESNEIDQFNKLMEIKNAAINKKKLDEIAQLIDHPEQAKLDYLTVIKNIIERVE